MLTPPPRVRLTRPVSTAPGPSSTKRSTPRGAQRQQRLAPAHGAQQVLGQLAAHVDEGRGAAVGVDRDASARATGVRLERRAQALGGRLHERGVEGAGDVEAPGAGAGLVARDLLGLVERVDGPAEHELAGGVVVGDHEAQARRPARARRGASPPSIAIMPPALRSPASAIAAARSSTSRTASSNCSAPAATSAAYSPSEWPAAALASSSSLGLLAPGPTPRPSTGTARAAGSACPRRGARRGRSRAARGRARTAGGRGRARPSPRRGSPGRGRAVRWKASGDFTPRCTRSCNCSTHGRDVSNGEIR